MRCGVAWRLALLAIPVLVGFFTYYIMLSSTGALCALIGLTASLFCLPGEGRLRKNVHINKKKKCNRLENMNKSYFCSERVRLRAMEPEDLEVMYAMENDSQTWDVTNFTVPYSRFVLKQYIENSECDMFADRQLRMMIIRVEDDAVIGTIDITEFSPMHARGEVGIAIRKEYQAMVMPRKRCVCCATMFSVSYI